MRTGIALGSNLGDRLHNLRIARKALQTLHEQGAPMLSSRVWETEPIDCAPEAARYLNAVVEIEFSGDPITLLHRLQAIEREMGRPARRPRNAPRIVDLDILYAGDTAFKNDEVTIPHPRMLLRRFVLEPLRDIRPDLVAPDALANTPEADVKIFAEGF